MLAPVTEADFGEQDLLALNVEGRALWGGVRRRAGAADRAARRLRRLRLPGGGRRPRRRGRAAPPARVPARAGPGGRVAHAQRGPRAGAGAVAAHRRRHQHPRRRPGRAARGGGRAGRGAGGRGRRAAGGHRGGGADRRRRPRDRRAHRRRPGDRGRARAGGLRRLERPAAVRGRAGRARGAAGQGPAAGAARARRPGRRPPPGWCARPRCYVVCRADGRVVIGATTEERGFDTTVTADGVFRLLEAAMRGAARRGRAGARRRPRRACARAPPTAGR